MLTALTTTVPVLFVVLIVGQAMRTKGIIWNSHCPGLHLQPIAEHVLPNSILGKLQCIILYRHCPCSKINYLKLSEIFYVGWSIWVRINCTCTKFSFNWYWRHENCMMFEKVLQSPKSLIMLTILDCELVAMIKISFVTVLTAKCHLSKSVRG